MLAIALLGMIGALIGFLMGECSNLLIRLDTVYAIMYVLAYPVLLALDPHRPVGLRWYAVPALIGTPVALAALAVRYDEEL